MLGNQLRVLRGYSNGSISKTTLVVWAVFALVALRFVANFLR